VTQVVDQTYDVGRSPSVVLDKGGQPAVAYLLLQPKLKKGAIPPPLLANTPQPPSVVEASQQSAIWTRRNVTPNAEGGGKGTATEIAEKDGLYDGKSTVAMAVDAKGFHHVVWSTPSGLFYAEDSTVDLKGGKTALVFSGDPATILSKPVSGGSIAVTDDGTPWVAFYSEGHVKVATLRGSSWSVQDVDAATVGGVAARTAIAVVQGTPLVAYQAPGGLTIAAPTDLGSALGLGATTAGGWASEPVVGANGPAAGLSMVVPASGSEPVVSYIESSGTVSVAARAGTARWTVARAGNVGKTEAEGADPTALTTGLGSDANGNLWVAWPDLANNAIVVGRGSVAALSFRPTPLPESVGGWSPSVALSPDGKHGAVAWYDSINKHLNVATLRPGKPVIALPSPPFSPLPSPTPGGLPCFPTGTTTLPLSAPAGAAGTGFSTACLAEKPDTPFAVDFSNGDTAPHNFAIYTDSQATKLLGGAASVSDIVAPGASTTYQVKGLPAGEYFFRCDVHPTTMTGTFVVTSKKAQGSPSPSPSASPSA
jgi:hypothetical protein